uniref:ZZ-type domain-containing protein n=1 Tax=Amphimedon queenslandica TaxID=400682 RepID=A0A1X7T7Q1_AMPQE
MSLIVKASLYGNWGRPEPLETRRFSIDQEVATSFTYLTQKLAQVFSNLEADKIIVTYADADGDKVTISTDDELTEALSQFDGTIFRIAIKSKRGPAPNFFHDVVNFLQQQQQQQQQQSAPPPDPEKKDEGKEDPPKENSSPSTDEPTKKDGATNKRGPYHPGVICDGCSFSIYGKRFKCCICPDYDLCEDCEGKGLHTDHDMFTIDRPAFCGGGAGGWPFFRPNPSGSWGGQGQLGPFDFKFWTNPGRFGGGPFGGPFGFGCCPGGPSTGGGANGCCPPKNTEQQKPTEDMETSATSAEDQPGLEKVEKKEEEEQ